MAWVCAGIGMLAGLLLALAAWLLAGWPLWLALALYPFAAAAIMLAVLAVLLLRSSKNGEASAGRKRAAPRDKISLPNHGRS